MPLLRLVLIFGFAAMIVAPGWASEPPQVAASIRPVHSLVAGVMEGIGEPHLLVAGADSPHTYAMRPSEAEALVNAQIVFWIGPQFETFLQRPIETIGEDVRSVPLIETAGLVLYDYEEDEPHDHHDHGGGHGHASLDGHIWLDPANARVLVDAIAAELARIDAANAAAYRRNAEELKTRLAELESAIGAQLAPHREVPYLSFHESFRYFAERFGLNRRGAIAVSPERQPGAQRLGEIRDEVADYASVCIFTEPQFPPRLVEVIVEGSAARTGVVDPIGAGMTPGPELYFELLRFNADAFAGCLSGPD